MSLPEVASVFSPYSSAFIFTGQTLALGLACLNRMDYGRQKLKDAHSDGLTVRWSDQLIIEESLFEDNSDAIWQ